MKTYAEVDQAYACIRAHLAATPNPVIFELGLCDGCHTRLLLSWCQSAPRYHGFEPDPRNIAKVQATDLPQRIHFHTAAMGRVTGPQPFHLATPEPNGCTGASSLSTLTPVLTECWPWLKLQETITVPSWRLDDFCAQEGLDLIDFIWMDVQGGERLVFEGAARMLPRTRLIWTEYDGGTLYQDSSTLDNILTWFPGWAVLADCGGDVLLKNPAL